MNGIGFGGRATRMTAWLLGINVVLLGCGDSTVTPEPEPPVASVIVTPSTVQLFPGDTVRLRAEARSASGAPLGGRTFTWTSTGAAIASVDSSGLVTGHGVGAARIRATSGGRTGTSDAEVVSRPPVPVASVSTTPSDVVLTVGDTVRLTAVPRSAEGEVLTGRLVIWASDGVDVASVDAHGLVTAIGEGSATVWANVEGVSSSVVVFVTMPPPTTPILTSIDPVSIQAGWGSFTLEVRGEGFVPQSRVVWAGLPLETHFVSTTEVRATVSSSYVAAEGTFMVSVETPTPTPLLSNAVPFTVHAKPAHAVELLVPGNAVFLGHAVRLAAVARDQFGDIIEGKSITWTSSDSTVVRVEGDVARGLRLGTATLVATAEPTFSGMSVSVVESPVEGVVFEAAPLGDKELFMRSLDPVGGVQRLLPPTTLARQAAVTADGGRIAFVGRDGSDNQDIYVVRADGSDLQRLTTDAAIDDQPAWSPDGQLLAFRSLRDGRSDVWVMNADGTEQRNLTFASVFIPEEYNERPDWSPDGQTLVFSRGLGVTQALYTIGLDGSGMTLLASRSGVDLLEPDWSSDGQVIAFRQFDRGADRSTVELVSSGTGEPVYFFWAPPIGSRTPRILPDGWIVVSAPVLPGSSVRTLAFFQMGWGRLVVPMGAEYGALGEPAVFLR